MPKLVAPKLKTSKIAITAPPKNGVWTGDSAALLHNFSEALDIADAIPNSTELTGIPTIWARPFLFETALYTDNHPMKKRIIGEWRGLLALIALKDWLRLPHKAVCVPLAGAQDTPDANSFLGALRELAPTNTISIDTDWHNPYVILFNGKPVGMTSPSTLVCTAASTTDKISSTSVPWFPNGEYLDDPVKHLNAGDKVALASWLDQTIGALSSNRAAGDIADKMFNKLADLINNYITDLVGEAPSDAMPLSIDGGIGITRSILRFLNSPVAPPVVNGTDVELVSERMPDGITHVLVVDKEIPNQLNKRDNDLRIWGNVTFAQYPFGGNSDPIRGQLPNNVKMLTLDDVFTKKMVVVKNKEAFAIDHVHQFDNAVVSPIPPLRHSILQYLTPQSIVHGLKIINYGRNIKVILELRLRNIVGMMSTIKLEKTYSLTDEHQNGTFVTLEEPPLIAIWPKLIVQMNQVQDNTWRDYRVFSVDNNEIAPFEARPLTGVHQELTKDNLTMRITRMNRYPEALACTMKYTIGTEEAGLILLKQPEPTIVSANDTCRIGIDFGTTNTIAYMRMDGLPEPLFYDNGLLARATNHSDTKPLLLYQFFLPYEKEAFPFLTLYHDFSRELSKDGHVFMDGHAYYLQDYGGFNVDKSIYSNIKWGNKPEERDMAKMFLRQLALQCAATAASKNASRIEWSYSYPTAFSTDDGLSATWNEIVSDLSALTGIQTIGGGPREMTESIAAARYFERHPDFKAGFQSGVVCMDIGGGTTDISIWQGNNPLAQASLRLAGRDLFLDLLRNNLDVVKKFGLSDVQLEKLQKATQNPYHFYALMDAFVSKYGHKWIQQLPVVCTNDDVKKLLHIIRVGVSGLFFYAGLMLKSLKNQGKYNDNNFPYVYLAGNGGKLLDWLSMENDNLALHVTNQLEKIMRSASGFTGGVCKISRSSEPKHETAYGLVCEGAMLVGAGEFVPNSILAGEPYKLNGETHPRDWNTEITKNELSSGIEVGNVLFNMEIFIEYFNNIARSSPQPMPIIASDERIKDAVKRNTNQELGRYKGTDIEGIHLDSLFILELKSLLSELSIRGNGEGHLHG